MFATLRQRNWTENPISRDGFLFARRKRFVAAFVPSSCLSHAVHQLEHEGFANLRGNVHCSTPSFHLDEFSGALDLSGLERRQPVDDTNMVSFVYFFSPKWLILSSQVIRGTILRNTPWIVCLACYTGFSTKLALNSTSPPSKYSALNRMVDWMVIAIIVVQVGFFCLAVCV